jgi:hypothetical protein
MRSIGEVKELSGRIMLDEAQQTPAVLLSSRNFELASSSLVVNSYRLKTHTVVRGKFSVSVIQ